VEWVCVHMRKGGVSWGRCVYVWTHTPAAPFHTPVAIIIACTFRRCSDSYVASPCCMSRYQRVRELGKKGYVQLVTTQGNLNIEVG
jgi:hypothetical protein